MATAICKTPLCSPLKSMFFLFAPVRRKGYVEREIALPSLEKEGGTFQGLLCLPLKSGGFFGTFVCTGKGYVERGYFSGLVCWPLKSGGFFGTFGCTGKGYIGRKLLLLRSRERRALIQGSLCSPLKSGGFFGTFECTGKGYVERENYLTSLEREGVLYRACFAHLSKVLCFSWHFCVHW